LIWRTHDAFNAQFEKLRRFYGGMLAWALSHRAAVTGFFAILVIFSLALIPLIGQDFFPSVDAGQLRMHVRAPAGRDARCTRGARLSPDLLPPRARVAGGGARTLADRGDMSTADEHRHSSAHFADAVEEASGAQGDDRLRRGSSEQCGEKGSER